MWPPAGREPFEGTVGPIRDRPLPRPDAQRLTLKAALVGGNGVSPVLVTFVLPSSGSSLVPNHSKISAAD
jgi:hypothetical protein